MEPYPTMTTGLPGLDAVLKGILPGDNVVWQVSSVEEYKALIRPFVGAAIENGKRVVYFRLAGNEAPLSVEAGVEIHDLDPDQGFESFIAAIHEVIERSGSGTFYVFDCLSRLAADWHSDQMLANFFTLTCAYLLDLETAAYFAVYRNYHTSQALESIQETTQLFLDVYRYRDEIYVRPIKVHHRYSPTMHMLHVWRGDEFKTVTSSVVVSEIMTSTQWSGLASDSAIDLWEGSFDRAQALLKSGAYRPDVPGQGKDVYDRLVRMVISREPHMQRLVARYLSLQDILDVRKRMIGTGLVGGKTVGMLLARAILRKAGGRLAGVMEEQDSFYVGSDVFYDFLVRSGVWWLRQRQRDPQHFLDGAEEARRGILVGEFAPEILRSFEEMIDYFGQSPFIVRSSSLLEDNYGNSFAGKYESVFCANQGPREQRLQDLLGAIRSIYASSMGEKALQYRADRGMLDRDERMALLVMRVSGERHGRHFYPQVAGVGFSFNPYAWDPAIDPKAGVVRLVFGLGTRAVDRSDDDYTRVIALNVPEKRPETNFDEIAQYAQRRVDYLNLETNQLASGHFLDLISENPDIPLELFASRDRMGSDGGSSQVLTFDGLLKNTGFVGDLRDMLQTLQLAYDSPVDVEFSANFTNAEEYRINVLQCRPLQIQGASVVDLPDVRPKNEDIIIEARGAVVGQSRIAAVDRFVYVSPSLYGKLPLQARYEVARLLGAVNQRSAGSSRTIMMLGPGRWGTTSPQLGLPVAFSHINRISVLCEIVAMHENLVPDVSLGTHFLNEIVERNILYLALFPQQGHNYLNLSFFEESPSLLLDLVPDAQNLADVVRVIDSEQVAGGASITLVADAVRQKVVCYFER